METDKLDGYILRYKLAYSLAALLLGVGTVLGGMWLGSLDGYHTEPKGLLLHVFGCAILINDNNMYPSVWLVVIGLLIVILTQYRVRTGRKVEENRSLDTRVLRTRFAYAISGLVVGLLVSIYGLTFAESGRNLCPADLVPNFPILYPNGYFSVGAILMLVGVILITVTRFRIRIHKNAEIAEQ